jgi:hypothetical protein
MDAINTYINLLSKVRTELERINQFVDDHGEVTPDDVNWGHVGFMGTMLNDLENIANMIDGKEQ